MLLVFAEAGMGGLQASVAHLARALVAAGCTVTVACGGTSPLPGAFHSSTARAEVEVVRLPSPRSMRGWLAFVVGLRSLARGRGVEVIHAHGLRLAWPAAIAACRRVGVAVTIHGMDPDRLARSAALARRSRAAFSTDGVGWVRPLGAAGMATTVLPNVVPSFEGQVSRTELCDRFGLNPGLPICILPVRLSPQKDPVTALRAIAHLDDVQMVVLGDGPLRVDLEAMVHDRGIGDRVVFSGWIDDGDRCIAAADLVVVSSRWEGQALAMLVAMAAGVPICATDVIGIGDWLCHGEAVLVPQGDARALADAIALVLGDAEVRDQLVDAGRRRVREHLESEVASVHLDHYRRLVVR